MKLILLGALSLVTATASVAALEPLATFTGSQDGEQFGFAVAMGGDANDDGRGDLAVGCPTNDENGTNAGRVAIFFGHAAPGGTPDLVLLGPPDSFFGSAVHWAGDVNGDGHDDLIVGAYRDAEGGANAGKAYLFLGGDPMPLLPALTLTGPGAGSYFGRSVCGAGDLNGDGRADFAVGAPRTANGTVHIYYGGNPPDGTPDLILEGAAADDRFGAAMAGPGNVDGIAGDDLLIGAPRASPTHLWQGSIYLFSGGAAMDDAPDWSADGAGAGDQLGSSVAGAGDVNGDSAADLIAGAPYYNVGPATDAGAAYIYYGGAGIDTGADFVISGSELEENLGYSVAGCGDATGSGFSHVLVGAPGNDEAGADAGRVVVSPGGNPPEQADLESFYGQAGADQFGFAVHGRPTGDSFTGTSHPDLVIGVWGDGAAGSATVYGVAANPAGAPDLDRAGWAVRVSPNPGREFGVVVTGPAIGAATELRIIGLDGRLIRTLEPLSGNLGERTLRWDGRNASGEPAPPGLYVIEVRIGGSRFARKVVLLR